jgi:hypothetical protein
MKGKLPNRCGRDAQVTIIESQSNQPPSRVAAG